MFNGSISLIFYFIFIQGNILHHNQMFQLRYLKKLYCSLYNPLLILGAVRKINNALFMMFTLSPIVMHFSFIFNLYLNGKLTWKNK